MKNPYALFISGISWGAVEAVVYRFGLLAHTIGLFYILPITTYGSVGALFSLCYLAVNIATAGVDSIVASSLGSNGTQQTIRKTLFAQCLYVVTLATMCFGVTLLLKHDSMHNHLAILVLIFAIVCIESCNKILKAFLATGGLFKQKAFADLGLMSSYVGMVWTLYLGGVILDVWHLLMPFLLSTVISCCYLWYNFAQWYGTMPTQKSTATNIQPGRWRIQIQTTVLYATHQLYSGNMLVPFMAHTIGVAHAGIFKFITNCIHQIVGIIEKTFATASAVLFAQTTNKNFAFTLSTLYLMPLTVFVALGISAGALAFFTYHTTISLWYTVVAYVCIHACDLITKQYERFFIQEQQTGLALTVSICITACALGMWSIQGSNPSTICIYLASARIMHTLALAGASYRLWHTVPSLTYVPSVAITFAVLALVYAFV